MPSAPRERKPLLVVLALLLIVAGAGVGGLLVTRMTNRVAAIEVSTTIGQGQPITAADLTEVQIASDSGVSYVPWSEAAAVIKDFAATEIPVGTLLSAKMVAAADNLVAGRDTLGLSLKEGQMPADLQVGQSVMVYSTSTSTTGCPGTPGGVLATNATVLSVAGGTGGSGVTDVEIAVDPGSAGDVACNTANGTAAIAVMPGKG
jgi:hypothetical protein